MQVDHIATSLRAQIIELERQLGPLHTALEAIEALDETSPAPPGSQVRTEPRRPRSRPTTRGRMTVPLTSDRVLSLVTTEGVATRELSAQLLGSIGQTRAALRRLEDRGQIRRTGIRSTVRWHRVNLTETEKLKADQQAIIEEAELVERRHEAGIRAAATRATRKAEIEKEKVEA